MGIFFSMSALLFKNKDRGKYGKAGRLKKPRNEYDIKDEFVFWGYCYAVNK